MREKVTIGVLDRVEQLADRPEGYRPSDSIDYVYSLPLKELISLLIKNQVMRWKDGMELYNILISNFGGELSVLTEVSYDELSRFDQNLAELILKTRNNQLKIQPGYDGLYGKPLL